MTTKREEWAVYEFDARTVVDSEGFTVAEAYDGKTRDHAVRLERARRIAAVPDMEAALMAALKCDNPKAPCEVCLTMFRAALRKAGRIP